MTNQVSSVRAQKIHLGIEIAANDEDISLHHRLKIVQVNVEANLSFIWTAISGRIDWHKEQT